MSDGHRRRVLLVLPTQTYRAADFVDAARRLGAEIVVASEERQALADAMGERALEIDLCDPDAAADAIVGLHARAPVDALFAVDDQGVEVAALAAERLGLPHNPPDAVRATRDKTRSRRLLTEAGLRQPAYRVLRPGEDAVDLPFPVVAKAPGLAASRGVIRADDANGLRAAVARIRRIVGDEDAVVLVEAYVPGDEVALEGLLADGELDVLALFDKPDPLTGPYFEETIYTTPSRKPDATQTAVADAVTAACRAIGLVTGPVHAEARIDGDDVVVLEVAGRSIGGLCSRTLTFGLGMSLEEVLLRHALGRPTGRLTRDAGGAGVMMLPIPRAGILRAVHGREATLAVPGIVGLEITAPLGRPIAPLPDGDRYLGFLFSRASTPEEAEAALRRGHAALDVVITAEDG